MSATLRPYPANKASALDALGTIPAHWSEVRAKYLFREVDDRSISGDEELLSVSHITGVTPRSQKNVTMFLAESNVGHKRCQPDDLVINTMWAWMGALGVSRFSGIVSPSYGVYRPKTHRTNSGFIDQLLRTNLYVDEYMRRSTGINSSRLRLYPDGFLRLPILIPPVDEQEQITRFIKNLLQATTKLIRAKRQVIELLNEQKQAIIHRAVTRGLDPNVRLKPSGIRWLGDVPEHWNVLRFKQRIGFQEGPGIMANDFRDHGVPLLRISCLGDSEATLEGCNFLDSEMVRRRWSHFAVRAGDYLLSASASTGSVVKASEVVEGSIPYTGILRLWPLSADVFMPFVRLYIGSSPFQSQIDSAKSGVAIEHFGPTHLKRMFICLPPENEQRSIVELIEKELSEVQSNASRALQEIDLIREYRTRLIADVVTGKLDVRGVELPEAKNDEAVELLGESDNEDLAEADDAQEDVTVEA